MDFEPHVEFMQHSSEAKHVWLAFDAICVCILAFAKGSYVTCVWLASPHEKYALMKNSLKIYCDQTIEQGGRVFFSLLMCNI